MNASGGGGAAADASRFGAGGQPNGANGVNGAGAGAGGYGAGGYGAGYGGAGGYYGGDGVPVVGGGAVIGTAQMTVEGPPQVKAGDSVTVSLSMSADQPVASASSTVSFDTTKLQFIGVTEGDFMKQGGAPTSFSSRIGTGQVQLSNSVQGGMGAASTGTYAVLSFKALAPASQTSVKIAPGSVVGSDRRADHVHAAVRLHASASWRRHDERIPDACGRAALVRLACFARLAPAVMRRAASR